MREILFRGIAKNGEYKGKWVYGGIAKRLDDGYGERYYITVSGIYSLGATIENEEVIPETIGQSTGLYDKNGKEIYEGDIVKIVNNYSEATKRTSSEVIVKFKDGSFIVTWDVYGDEHYNHFTSYNTPVVTFEVIGNIHEDSL